MRIVAEAKRTVREGDRFGRLEAIGIPFYVRLPKQRTSEQHAVFKCDCGGIVVVRTINVRNGTSRSCGCRRGSLWKDNKGSVAHPNRTHGQKNSRLYSIWAGIKNRCFNPKRREYPRYGGAGITMCDEWAKDFTKFYDWAMANGYGPTLSVDRLDGKKGYEPSNCEWVTRAENTARAHRARKGKLHCVANV